MLEKIKKVVFRIIYFFVIIYLLIFIPTIWKDKPLVVISGSMEPTLSVGGVLYYHDKKYDQYEIGDILVYKLEDHIISHRIYDITENGIITKGDANSAYDSLLIKKEQILGEGTNWCIPLIGYYADFIYSHKIVLWISFLIVSIDVITEKNRGEKHEKDT